MQIPSFVGQSYTLGSANISTQRAVNLYPQLSEALTKNAEQYNYLATPGLRLLTTLTGGKVRGIYTASNGRAYAVCGRKVYEITIGSNSTTVSLTYRTGGDTQGVFETFTTSPPNTVEVGSLDEAPDGPVSMADNGVELMIVASGTGYLVNFAKNELRRIQQDAWIGGGYVTYIDGYFIVSQANSRAFFISGAGQLDDGSQWDALDYDLKATTPDNLVKPMEAHDRLLLLGKRRGELWWNSGAVDFPFERQEVIEVGTVSGDAAVTVNGAPTFISSNDGGNISVVRLDGMKAVRVSTHAVELALARCPDLESATAWTYGQGGHHFYCLNLPGSPVTWVLDATTGLWHERTYLDAQRGEQRHRAEHHCYVNGMHIVADYDNGKLYELSETTYSDDTAPIRRSRRFPHLSQQGVRLVISRLQIDMETGIGLDGSGNGTDPKATLRWSKDGGHSWCGSQTVSIGKIGEKQARAIFRRLGVARDVVFELEVSDSVPVTLISAWMDAKAGNS
jgi:hypothetical protein